MKMVFCCIVLLLAAVGCAPQTDASDAVEGYLQALVNKDRDRFLTQFCADFESDALIEFDSFGAVEAELDGVDCRTNGTAGEATLVTCSGSIAVTYQGEDNEVLSLEDNVYRVVQEGGEWKLCGYN